MKILALTFDSEMAGGANRSFLMVIRELIKQFGHEVYVVVPNHGPIEQPLTTNGIPYEIIPIKMQNILLNGSKKDPLRKIKANLIASYYFAVAFRNKSRLKNENFDVVYVNCANQLVGGFLAKMLKLPCIWHFRGRFSERNYYIHNQKKFYSSGNNQIIVISSYMQRSLHEIAGIPSNKITLIHNGIEDYPVLPSKQDRSQGIHCVLCGRIMKAKGQQEAIQAIHLLRTEGYDVYLHIAGSLELADQTYLAALYNCVEEWGLNSNVIFEDQIENMSRFREQMNIELMCSEAEPFGRVTVEGMRSGLVVIGANTGGTLDIIQDELNGLLYLQGDAMDLAEKIKRVIDDEEFANMLANNAIYYTRNHFTVRQNVEKINTLLTNTVEGVYIDDNYK